MSLAIFAAVGASVALASLASRAVDLGYTEKAFLAKLRVEAMNRHNEVLEELLADPAIENEVKESVCFIGRECFEKASAVRLLNYILYIPKSDSYAEQLKESVLVSEAVGSALDVAVTYSAEGFSIPEKSRVSLMRRPGLALAVAA